MMLYGNPVFGAQATSRTQSTETIINEEIFVVMLLVIQIAGESDIKKIKLLLVVIVFGVKSVKYVSE